MRKLLFYALLCYLIAPSLLIAGENEVGALSSSDLFGGGGNYVHPYIGVGGLYDDNVYNESDDTKGDSAIVLSPGIWLAVPGTRQKVLKIQTSNLTPGGLRMVQDRGREFKRMQGYLHYGADITRFSQESDSDTDDQRVEGYFQLNLKSGISLEFLDFFLDGHNDWGEGLSQNLDFFKSNLLGARVRYDGGNRIRLRADLSYYTVNYDDEASSASDRGDVKLATYLYYNLSPKSSIFAEYDFLDLSYDEDDYFDSKEHHMYGGIRWRISGKSMGEFKAGYLYKEYAEEQLESGGDFIFSTWVDYDFSEKIRFKLDADRIYEEPKWSTLKSITSDSVRLICSYSMLRKIKTDLSLGYRKESYNGAYYTSETVYYDREDNEYSATITVVYKIQDWLSTGLTYSYFDKDSSISELSYTDNKVLLSINFEL